MINARNFQYGAKGHIAIIVIQVGLNMFVRISARGASIGQAMESGAGARFAAYVGCAIFFCGAVRRVMFALGNYRQAGDVDLTCKFHARFTRSPVLRLAFFRRINGNEYGLLCQNVTIVAILMGRK